MLKLLTVVLLILSPKKEEGCWIVRSAFFGRNYAKFFRTKNFFFEKMAFFSTLALNLLEVDTLKLWPYSS